ncbi:uracil phosphoribosyl transferase [Pochonia chlamydosporia 170]|uniref:uracil phosphoribosyltransferase n=1 Tax=Pochonia chlamydosporia 170 TaxID=1380566 RepID=A0A179F5H7_METCM|nr:uracil phosphoribosyl transferase [Pochonia chlamydosporia 170]OAQ60678.1 uracil phosphoribosyl transferase [Pochonia chlamydosporia 170]
MSSLPNVHVSQHPSLRAKLSQLRSSSTNSKQVNALVNDISLILACEALAKNITPAEGPKDQTPLGFEYTTTTAEPQTICIVPILRSGLGMVEAVQTILPTLVPVHHLGMYREPSTLDPVEYYNNLPHHMPSTGNSNASSLAILVDPVIATGGTCAAAIQTLKEWGAKKVLVMSIIGAEEGVRKAAEEWPEGTELWIAGVDGELTRDGMLKPGLGDIGDRLFLTIGK